MPVQNSKLVDQNSKLVDQNSKLVDQNSKLVDQNNKIVIIGDSGVGKTCFMYRLIKNNYLEITNSTIGAAYFKENINYKNKLFTLEYWDTAGQERFRSILPIYFRGVNILLIVIDSTQDIKDQLTRWIFYYNNMQFFDKKTINKSHYVFLIFTKIDLVKDFQLPNNIKYIYEDYVLSQNIFLVSSKKNIGFDEFKTCLYNEIFNIYTFLSINKISEQNNKNINITDNNDNHNKTNYDYYMDKLKNNCYNF
jgi:small GTP-binding protein